MLSQSQAIGRFYSRLEGEIGVLLEVVGHYDSRFLLDQSLLLHARFPDGRPPELRKKVPDRHRYNGDGLRGCPRRC